VILAVTRSGALAIGKTGLLVRIFGVTGFTIGLWSVKTVSLGNTGRAGDVGIFTAAELKQVATYIFTPGSTLELFAFLCIRLALISAHAVFGLFTAFDTRVVRFFAVVIAGTFIRIDTPFDAAPSGYILTNKFTLAIAFAQTAFAAFTVLVANQSHRATQGIIFFAVKTALGHAGAIGHIAHVAILAISVC